MGPDRIIRDLIKILSLIILKPLFNDELSFIWKDCKTF